MRSRVAVKSTTTTSNVYLLNKKYLLEVYHNKHYCTFTAS